MLNLYFKRLLLNNFKSNLEVKLYEKNSDYPKWKLLLDLGKRNLELDENESAINVLSKSISIKQDNYLSFYYRAIAQHRLKNYILAIE